MNQTRPKLWTKDFIIVSSVNFFIALVFYLLLVTIAVYAVEEYGASESVAGLVTGILIIGTLIGRMFMGRIIALFDNKKILFFGLIFYTLSSSLYFFNISIAFLLITRFIHGIALGVVLTATGTIVAQIIPQSRKGEGIGFFSMSTIIATAIGPFIGLYLSQHTSYQTIFSFCLGLGVISLLIAVFLKIPVIERKTNTAEIKGFKLSNYIEPRALPIALVAMVIAFCYSSVLSFINFYAIEINLVDIASFFFIVYSAAILMSRPITGRLMDVKGANFVMYPAFILFGAGLLILSTANHGVTLLWAGLLIGFGYGNMQSITQAIAVKSTPLHRMGLATSTYFIFLDVGLGFGPYFLGFIIPLTGYRNLYIIMGLLVLASVVFYYFMHGKKESSIKASINPNATI